MAKSGVSDSEVDSDGEGNEVQSMETEQENPNDEDNILKICGVSENAVSKQTEPLIPISILIQSLVKSLCDVYESDSKKVRIIYNNICERLAKMRLIDESWHMEEFEALRATYQHALHKLLQTSISPGQQLVTIKPICSNDDLISSHYSQEFDEIEYIAGGGFGRVFRVKHKLDGTEYAIKKIPIAVDGIEAVRSYLSEVKTFASVNHSNIVQYKGAWLEFGGPNSSATLSGETQSLTEESESTDDDEYIYNIGVHSFSDDKQDTSSSDFEINFEPSISSLEKRGKPEREKRSSISEGGKAICKLDMNELRELNIQHRRHIKWATLYIQMALCQSTLKQWLQARNDGEFDLQKIVPFRTNVRNEDIYEVLRQLLRGLEYIHSKGIVHHDIKPSNIFIQIDNGKLLVQLGDFGLACPLQNARHSLAFGTKMYAAPEQLEGECDPKSDMYSLGIVLFELVERFRTDMERAQCIENLRKGKLPAQAHIQYPQLSEIICQLMEKYPSNRPSATNLLKIISDDANEYVRELECKLAEKDEELAEKDEEIDRLKQLLRTAGIKAI